MNYKRQHTASRRHATPKGRVMIKILCQQLNDLTAPAQTLPEQRVSTPDTHSAIDQPIQRVTQAPAIIKMRDPTAKRNLILTKRSHCWTTRNNAPGAVPPITRDTGPTIIPDYVAWNHDATKNYKLRQSPRLIGDTPAKKRVTFTSIHGPHTSRAQSNIISQHALNAMMKKEALYPPAAFSPSNLILPAFVDKIPNYAHYASPMIHPTTGETITSYKRLRNNPKTAEIWQTAFGKDFGGMVQGAGGQQNGPERHKLYICDGTWWNRKSKEKQKNIYVHKNRRPQKEDPNRIWITVGGNLIKYKGEVSTKMTDLTTLKLLWNSVLSTDGAKYMCLDIKKFYLTAALDYFFNILRFARSMYLEVYTTGKA